MTNGRSHSPPRSSRAAIFKLFANDSVYEGLHVLAEIDTQSNGPAIDARFNLSIEEWLSRMLPPALSPHPCDRMANPIGVWIHSEIAQ